MVAAPCLLLARWGVVEVLVGGLGSVAARVSALLRLRADMKDALDDGDGREDRDEAERGIEGQRNVALGRFAMLEDAQHQRCRLGKK